MMHKKESLPISGARNNQALESSKNQALKKEPLEDVLFIEQALNRFKEALQIDPHNADAWLGKGLALQQLGKTKESQECFDKAKEFARNSTPKKNPELF
jgi:tetratricopeptide (TPR) repeat protein